MSSREGTGRKHREEVNSSPLEREPTPTGGGGTRSSCPVEGSPFHSFWIKHTTRSAELTASWAPRKCDYSPLLRWGAQGDASFSAGWQRPGSQETSAQSQRETRTQGPRCSGGSHPALHLGSGQGERPGEGLALCSMAAQGSRVGSPPGPEDTALLAGGRVPGVMGSHRGDTRLPS